MASRDALNKHSLCSKHHPLHENSLAGYNARGYGRQRLPRFSRAPRKTRQFSRRHDRRGMSTPISPGLVEGGGVSACFSCSSAGGTSVTSNLELILEEEEKRGPRGCFLCVFTGARLRMLRLPTSDYGPLGPRLNNRTRDTQRGGRGSSLGQPRSQTRWEQAQVSVQPPLSHLKSALSNIRIVYTTEGRAVSLC